MGERSIGFLVIAAGISIVIIGLVIYSAGLSWFGRLPGDIRIERENLRVYVPITSMLLVSLVLSLIMYALRRFF